MGAYRLTPDGRALIEDPREIPVARMYDVIVAGGGSGGSGAAIAAGRMGARTLLIERNAYLGGTSTGGMMAVFWALAESFSGYMEGSAGRASCPWGGADRRGGAI